MPSQAALKEDSEIVLENTISLKQFPPKLRKLGKYLLTNDKPETLKEACEAVKVDYQTAKTLMWRQRKRGVDFQQFIEVTAESYLNENLLAVDRATLQGAVNGSHNDRNLYYKRIGKLQETPSLNINHLTIGVNIQGAISQDNDRNKGVIDTQSIIPKLK